MNWSDYFLYDDKTGELLRLKPFSELPPSGTWITRFYMKPAGHKTRNPDGTPKAVLAHVGHGLARAHRIIWEMHHGPIPDGMVIDHIDRNPFNNRVGNLRACTQADNCANALASRRSRTGVRGVHYDSATNTYRASINRHGKKFRFKRRELLSDAIADRMDIEARLFGEFSPNHVAERIINSAKP